MRYPLLPVFCFLVLIPVGSASCQGQTPDPDDRMARFNRADTLRGMLRPERTCYDVTYYRLDIQVDPGKRFVRGAVDIHFRAMSDFEWLQIDLFKNMEIESIYYEGKALDFFREHDAVFIRFPQVKADRESSFRVRYRGQPREAPDPPWEGGFVWSKDRLGRPWVGVACQGAGASLWWPNKDHLSDEPDSMDIILTVPDSLMGIANGQLIEKVDNGAWTQYHWKVSYPINNYSVSVNVGYYAHLEDAYTSLEEEDLDLDYYVLFYNRRRARPHLEQVKEVIRCYETYFGPYPFWKDGFALIETPYLGMEHQSGIAYGNKFMRGYLGGMIPPNMDWDYVIVHETAHEYFGNAVSVEDMAEIWLHESFATYLESLFVEYKFGKQEALKYLNGQRSFLENRKPLLGPKNVNWDHWSDPDNSYKGALMLNSLRHEIGSDTL
jgi:aminopeptidase N